jgi:hypothetical protein
MFTWIKRAYFQGLLQDWIDESGVIILASLLVFVPTMISFFCFLVPGIYLTVQWFVVRPPIVIEIKVSWTV